MERWEQLFARLLGGAKTLLSFPSLCMTSELTPSGTRLIRYEPRPDTVPDSMSSGDRDLLLAMEAHLDRCYGTGERLVFHETFSPTVHADIHVVPPSAEYPFFRLVTCGMAELPMNVPDGFKWSPYAEMTIALPASWPLRTPKLFDPAAHWPIELLRDFARLPHQYGTHVWEGHTQSWGYPAQPLASTTDLCGMLVLSPDDAPEGFDEFTCGDRTISILALIPLYADELELAMTDLNALIERIDAAELSDVVDLARPSLLG